MLLCVCSGIMRNLLHDNNLGKNFSEVLHILSMNHLTSLQWNFGNWKASSISKHDSLNTHKSHTMWSKFRSTRYCFIDRTKKIHVQLHNKKISNWVWYREVDMCSELSSGKYLEILSIGSKGADIFDVTVL